MTVSAISETTMRITSDELLELACKADEIIREHAGQRPFPDEWKDAYYLRENALAAAKWLEEGGLTEIEQLGPFGRLDIKVGDTVLVKKGAVILSMNPRYTREHPKIAGRPYKVKVHSVHEGRIASHWHSHRRDTHETHSQQQISWAGDGGYWCYLDTKDVELVPVAAPAA